MLKAADLWLKMSRSLMLFFAAAAPPPGGNRGQEQSM
jgi:hypothetical protein